LAEQTPQWEQQWVDAFLLCPKCGGAELVRNGAGVGCLSCKHEIPVTESAVLVNLPADVPLRPAKKTTNHQELTHAVRQFYEENPFPNYDGFESVGDLLGRASRSVYAAMLDQQIPIGSRILEVGCGTGQLSAFLSIGGRAVVGVDMTLASLRLAGEFKLDQGLRDCNFLQADLFELPLKPESFDLVICKGVLHHTPDPRRGLEAILRMLRPGGYVIAGFYNRIGRIPTSLRRIWFQLFRGDPKSVDLVLRTLVRSDEKAVSWYLDQYAHPLESRHTVDEVLRWFKETDVEFLQAVPPLGVARSFDPLAPIFEAVPPGTRLSHWLTQLKWILTIGREGALFDMVGRKRGGEA
jgi:SAM-dependent methyltransferase